MQKVQPQKDNKAALPRVIAISSGKGGVGKSSIAINLGISLAKSGARVCLLDADTGLANANILLGLTPQYNLEHVLYGAKNIEDVMLDGPHGMKIIPGANGISECVSLHPRQQLRLIRELARIETEFDFLLIDTAAGIAETTLDFIGAAHHTLVVITPEPTSLTDAFSLIKLLKRRRSTVHYHIVVNMCGSAGQAKEVFHRFSAAVDKYIGVKCQYLGYVLRDESMRAAVVLQNPVAMFPDSDPSCRGFVNLAKKLDEATNVVPASGSFSAYWHRQYRDQRGSPEQGATTAIKAVPDADTAETRDSDYLSELRSRMLLLIEQGNAEPELIQGLIQESLEAFVQRHNKSPVDVVKLVDQLVALPERNDQLLRQIAQQVSPWSGGISAPPWHELSLKDMADDAGFDMGLSFEQDISTAETFGDAFDAEAYPESEFESEPDQESEPDPIAQQQVKAIEPVAEVLTDQSPVQGNEAMMDAPIDGAAPPVLSERSEPPEVNKTSIRPHCYDSARFGSQENLLDILVRQSKNDKPLLALLDAFL